MPRNKIQLFSPFKDTDAEVYGVVVGCTSPGLSVEVGQECIGRRAIGMESV